MGLLLPATDPFTFHRYTGVNPPFVGTAVKVTEEPTQTVVAGVEIITLTGSNGLTIMVIVLEMAGLISVQVSLDVSSHVTRSLLAGTYENAGLLVPATIPFTFQRYAGVKPPFAGTAVKVTDMPEQILFTDSEIDTLTGSNGFTVMVRVLDVAGLPVTHVSLEVISQLTISRLAGT